MQQSRKKQSSQSTGFDKFVMLINPRSTNGYRAEAWIADIRRLAGRRQVIVLTMMTGDTAENAVMLRAQANKLGPKTLLCIAGGDGTVSFVTNFLLSDKRLPDRARTTVLLPLWAGNGNDMAIMLNGLLRTAKLDKILRQGRIATMHPLQCYLTDIQGNTVNRLANNCIGFGVSGLLCKRLNDETHRRKISNKTSDVGVLLQTVLAIWRGLVTSPTFAIETSAGRQKIFERTFYNGPRVAGYYHQPVRLFDEYFYMDTFRYKWPVITPLSAVLSFHRRSLQWPKAHLCTSAGLTVLEPVWMQLDGEPVHLKAHTRIKIKISEQPIYVLSTTA